LPRPTGKNWKIEACPYCPECWELQRRCWAQDDRNIHAARQRVQAINFENNYNVLKPKRKE
jgi:hypothetical protein